MKKFVLAIALLFISISPAWAVTLLSSTCGGAGASGGTTSAINTTGATLIVVSEHYFNGSPTVSDSKSNTWTGLTTYISSQVGTRIFYVINPATDASHTFTLGGGTSFGGICIEAFSGTAAFDVENGATGGAVTSISPGSVTPTQDNELIISDVTVDSSGTISVDSGFTIPGTVVYSGGVNDGGAMGYKIQTAATAVNPTWSYSGSVAQGMASATATFKSLSATNNTIGSGTFRSVTFNHQ